MPFARPRKNSVASVAVGGSHATTLATMRMTEDDSTRWVSAHRRVTLEIRSPEEIPPEMEISQHIRDGIARGATFVVTERSALGFEAWCPVIIERCPPEMSWGAGCDDPEEQADLHASFAGWIWDEINDELPEGTEVVDVRYAGPTGCDSEECPATDCTLMWDVTDSTGSVRRVDVPI